MKCCQHNTVDAVAVCAWCGRAVCPACLRSPPPARIACSEDCRAQLERADGVLTALLERSRQSARASAVYCYLSAGLSAAGAVAAWFLLPSPFLIYFTGGCALVLVLAGYWHGRAGRAPVKRPF